MNTSSPVHRIRPGRNPAVHQWLLLVVLGLISHAAPLFAASDDGFQQAVFVSGLIQPTTMAFAPDGRLFVAEKAGRLRVVQDGALLAQPFVTIAGLRSDGERGLLGVAFDPQFASNGYVYVYYSYDVGVDGNRVSRFTADPANPNAALSGSELILLNGLPEGGNHDGGALHFGPDGHLYVAIGDVGTASNAQSLSTPAGKILRIAPATYPNIIPPDNPFVGVAGAREEIWALGLRNPFTFAFNPTDGSMYINDVGQNTWEEINLGAAGANYGWPVCEGPHTSGVGSCQDPAFSYPVHAYRHPLGYAITGGAFYYGSQFPDPYLGSYFYADYVGNWIRRLSPDRVDVPFFDGTETPVDLDVGPDGALYYLSIDAGTVYRIHYSSNNTDPVAAVSATPTVGLPPLTVTFDGRASSDPDGDPLTYAWDFGDGSPAGSGPMVSHQYTAQGRYTARLTVNDGAGGSDFAVTVITVGNPPFGSITSPSEGTRYSAGDTIAFSGTADDPEDGALSGARFSWTVVFHHDTHTHPFLGPIQGVTSGSFTIPTVGEAAANVFYRVHLTVTDSTGLIHQSTRDVLPRTATLRLTTEPAGLVVTLDGQPVATPASVPGVAGMTRTLGAASPQTLNGQSYAFAGWSDGGAQTHAITTPAVDADYTASFLGLFQPKNAFLSFSAADGASDHVLIPATSDVAEGAALTVSLWARTPVAGAAMHLLAKGKSGFEQWTLRRVDANNRVVFNVREQNSNMMIAATSPSNQGVDGQWHHYAGVYDAVTRTVRLYIDGSDAATTVGTIDEPMRNDDEAICLGARSASATACATTAGWQGDLDDVRIWNRALSAAEIQAGMANELTGAESGLIAYWPLNEGAGQSVADRAPGHHAGRLGSSPGDDPNDPTWISISPPPPSDPPADTIPPEVMVTSPSNGAVVSGTVTLSAHAADDGGVAGVQFELNGIDFGPEDQTVPYAMPWDTTAVSDGVYSLVASARDAAGNVTVSPTVVVTVQNAGEGSPPAAGPKTVFLRLGNADGAADHVLIPATSDVAEGAALTVSLWARTPVAGAAMHLLAKGKSGFEQWTLRRVDANNRVVFNVREQNSNAMIAATSPSNQGADGQWHHYAGVYDAAARTVRLYIDGSDAATTVGTIDEPMRNDDEAICLGARSASATACATTAGWQGDLDDVRIWNRALSAAEIQAGMANELTGAESGLIAYWPLNEGAGQSVADRAPGHHAGRLGSSPGDDPNDPAWASESPP